MREQQQQPYGFDPLEGVLTAQFAKPAELTEINLRTLNPFQRALLVIDGTVTKFIEAYTMEPVEIVRIEHKTLPVSKDQPWLDLGKGTPVIFREVVISGKYSRTFYVHAVSMLVPERLPDSVRDQLQVQGEGIGHLLNGTDLETRREIMWFGRERLKQPPAAIKDLFAGDFISRTYRIFTHGQPVALINERFPYAIHSAPSHH